MALISKCFLVFAIIATLFCSIIARSEAFSVELYDRKHFKGLSTSIEVKQGCVDVPAEWEDMISSIHPSNCVVIYKHPKCQGPRVRLEAWTFGTAYLKEINFEDKLSSLSPCNYQAPTRERRDEY